MAVTTQVAKQYNLNLKRFEPDNDDLRIWLENVSFDSVIAFIEELNRKHGVIIKQINTERSDQPGRVNLRATLGR
jgi:general secretion pathway protein M